ncbi:MAG: response regulator transcription factor [Spirochaetota bacterium]
MITSTAIGIDVLLEAMDLAESSLETAVLGRKMLDVFLSNVQAEGAFLLARDSDGGLTNVTLRNLDSGYSRRFMEYYNQFDPLQLLLSRPDGDRPQTVTRVISYDGLTRTEYYADFLAPQRIHHKLIVELVAKHEHMGRVVLMRNARLAPFGDTECLIAEEVAPYLAYALAHQELRRRFRVKESLLRHIEEDSVVGTILLDEAFQPIYMNDRARELCGLIRSARGNGRGELPEEIESECRALVGMAADADPPALLLPRHRQLRLPGLPVLSLCTKLLRESCSGTSSKMYMVHIEETERKSLPSPNRLSAQYRLTQRQLEVAFEVMKGLSNAQIARELNVTEITVKKHLQAIFDKVGVHNRVALMSEIVSLHERDA